VTEQIENPYDLATLESLDPDAFKGNDAVPQSVCNFVLTLALVFNDLRDLVYLHNLLLSKKPSGQFRISREWGAYNGLWYHSIRLMVALIHEVLNLLHDQQKTYEHPFFKEVLRQIPREAREQWNALVQAAQGNQVDTPAGKFALLVRNKLVYHYDPKKIFYGYSNFFSSQSPAAESAFLSRGESMSKTRYFFADAAASGYLTSGIQDQKGEDLLGEFTSLMPKLTFSLMSIIHQFIQKRGFAFRIKKDET
jgi:hypothetical protein